MFVKLRPSADSVLKRWRYGPYLALERDGMPPELQGILRLVQTVVPSEAQISTFVRTRDTTSVVYSLVSV